MILIYYWATSSGTVAEDALGQQHRVERNRGLWEIEVRVVLPLGWKLYFIPPPDP